jgi:uncharacterized protein YigA (DUF484 family)
MSQQHSGAAIGAPLTDTVAEDSIADYLKSHPDFFERHATVMLGLKLPHRAGGASISLVERQVSMLRQRNAQLERQLKDLVAVAKQNDALVEKIHQLCLKLMRAPTSAVRLEQLETGLREDFAAERAVLVLFPDAPAGAMREGFVRRMGPDDPDVRPFTTFLRAAKPRCGPLRDRQKTTFIRASAWTSWRGSARCSPSLFVTATSDRGSSGACCVSAATRDGAPAVAAHG